MNARIAPGIETAALALAFWALRVGSDRLFFDAVPESIYRHSLIAFGVASQWSRRNGIGLLCPCQGRNVFRKLLSQCCPQCIKIRDRVFA